MASEVQTTPIFKKLVEILDDQKVLISSLREHTLDVAKTDHVSRVLKPCSAILSMSSRKA